MDDLIVVSCGGSQLHDILLGDPWEVVIVDALDVELADYKRICSFVKVCWIKICFELLHREDQLVRVSEEKVFLNQALALEILFTASCLVGHSHSFDHNSGFLVKLRFKGAHSKAVFRLIDVYELCEGLKKCRVDLRND